MTSEHPTPGLQNAGDGNSFQTVVRGYHKRQVEDYIAKLQERISVLEAELEAIHREHPAAEGSPARARSRTYPQHERVSLRMAEILRLAEEEAALARTNADRHAAAVLEHARAEARALLAGARSTAEEVLRQAMRTCEEELAGARMEAARLIGSARRESTPTVEASRPAAAEGDPFPASQRQGA
jgi:cell division septum initiation protein DivIVA